MPLGIIVLIFEVHAVVGTTDRATGLSEALEKSEHLVLIDIGIPGFANSHIIAETRREPAFKRLFVIRYCQRIGHTVVGFLKAVAAIAVKEVFSDIGINLQYIAPEIGIGYDVGAEKVAGIRLDLDIVECI